MATRHTRAQEADGRPQGRRPFRWALLLLAIGAAVWFAPVAIVQTPLRDWPLAAAFAGIDGRISSRSATWNWFGTVEYRDVMLVDRAGRPVAAVRRMLVDQGLWRFLVHRADLGTVRLVGGEALVEVRSGGSGLEDVLAPWIAATTRAGATPAVELEVVDASVEVIDVARDDAWRITELIAAGSLRPGATLAGWTIAGRVVHTGPPKRDLAAAFAPPPAAAKGGPPPARLDRTTIVTGVTAVLARAGGWSVSAPNDPGAQPPRSLAVTGNSVPLDLTRVVATRFDLPRVLDGTADLRLDIDLPSGAAPEGLRVAGRVDGARLAVCRSDTLEKLVALERWEAPIDVSISGSTVTLRDCRIESPLMRAEASGRVGLPQGTAWEWAETLIGDDFAVAVDIDLAAASRSVSGGLQVRPDVRVAGGQLQIAAAARAEGTERVLEVRAGARDLEVVQGTRQLRWQEPFVGWLRSRRGAGRGDQLRVEEARVATSAFEVSASGTTESSDLQWTADLGRLVADAGEVLDLRGIDLAGTTRGRATLKRAPATGAATASLTGSVSGFRWLAAGRPDWIDDEITIDASAAGSIADGTMVIDAARSECAAAGDLLEITLAGGAVVDPSLLPSLVGPPRRGGAWVRPAPTSTGVSLDWMLRGDLAHWQARLVALAGDAAAASTRLGGSVEASASLAAQGGQWQVTRAGAEIENLVIDEGRIVEPRLVATAAGTIDGSSGRLDISSAEVLTSSLSLRTGGLAILPPAPGRADGASWMAWEASGRCRGRVQWQCDVGRMAPWFFEAATVERWPAAGRVWGTVDIQDTPAGLNLLLDATGNQLTLSAADEGVAAAGRADPLPLPTREVWGEQRARLVLEVTRAPVGDALTVNRMVLESSTLAAAAAGTVHDCSSRPLLDVGGTLNYDWSMLSRLLLPWTGGRLDLSGGAARPFALRAPVEPIVRLVVDGLSPGRGAGTIDPVATGDGGTPTAEVPLPETWLSTIRGGGREADPERPLRAALPVSLQPAARTGSSAWLRSLSIDSSTAWSAGTIEGMRLDAGETPLRLFEGQLALGPFDVGLGGGRLRGAPWLQLLPAPGELVVPKGRLIERMVLAGPLADRWMNWMFPIIGRSMRTQGLVSVDVAGARLPLGDPWAGDAAGQMVFENLEVTPGPVMAPLANLVAKLQAVIDPRFAFGDRAVLLRVRPEPVRVRLAGGRAWHDGLVMDMGQLMLRSAGSVGADGSLAMVVEVGFRGDLVAGVPALSKLMRTPLVIPLKGTADRPQFDAGAIDGLIARVVDNTAEAVIKDGFERGLEGLEELFGNPPPAAPALPLRPAIPGAPLPSLPPLPPEAPAPAPLSFPTPAAP
jgi:hypothetical protein